MTTETPMADEYFWSLKLDGEKTTEVWEPDNDAKEDVTCGHKLVIRKILLGPDAKEDEVNVIEAEAMMYKDLAKVPIAVLNKKGSNHVVMDVSFPDPPVTFTLKQGSGPVYLLGHHLIGAIAEEYEEIEDFDEEGVGDNEEDDISADDADAATAADGNQKKNGKTKRNETEDCEDEDLPKKKAKTDTSPTANTQSLNNAKKSQSQKNKKK